MDDDVAFILAAITAQLAASENRIARVRSGHGERFFDAFRHSHRNLIERAGRLETETSAAAGDDPALRGLHRQLMTLLESARDQANLVSVYAADVGRTDLPVGFMSYVREAVQSVSPSLDVEALVHVSEGDYGVRPMQNISAIIVEVPAADPTNALLMPTLVHEVAHQFAERKIASLNEDEKFTSALALALAERSLTDNESEIVQRDLALWLSELYCDAVATIVTGPSMLLALSARVAEMPWREGSEHPPAGLRIGVVMSLLRDLGWEGQMQRTIPDIVDWADRYSTLRQDGMPPLTRALVDAATAVSTEVLALANASGASALDPAAVTDRIANMTEHLRRYLLPVDLGTEPTVEWELLYAAWLTGLQSAAAGDPIHVSHIPEAAHDRQLNAMLTKTVELARVKQSWDRT